MLIELAAGLLAAVTWVVGGGRSSEMAVLLALVSAVAYGLSDFIGGLAVAPYVGLVGRRRRPGVVAASAWSSLALFVARRPDRAPTSPGALLAGVGSGTGTAFLYRGFSAGRMGVVAPVSAVGAALVPVLVGSPTGERPALLVWVGIVAALPGIWLVSRSPDDPMQAGGARESVAAGAGRRGARRARVRRAVRGPRPGARTAPAGGRWPLCQAVERPGGRAAGDGAARRLGAPRARGAARGALRARSAPPATGCFLLATQQRLPDGRGACWPRSTPPARCCWRPWCCTREVHRAQGVGLALCGRRHRVRRGGLATDAVLHVRDARGADHLHRLEVERRDAVEEPLARRPA